MRITDAVAAVREAVEMALDGHRGPEHYREALDVILTALAVEPEGAAGGETEAWVSPSNLHEYQGHLCDGHCIQVRIIHRVASAPEGEEP